MTRDDVRIPPRRYGPARHLVARAIERVGGALGGRALYRRRHLAAGRFRVREERVDVPALPAALEGFAIAQLSDLHAGPWLGRGDLRAVVDAVNARAPDLVALTGDFITRGPDDARLVAPDLARLGPRYGAFAVFGNHDYRRRREGEIVATLAAADVRVLRDRAARVPVGDATLAVLGLEDLEEAKSVDLRGALRDVRPGDVLVALCHHPSGGPLLARAGAALVLSGHTHGTQVDLPLLRRLGPPHPGLRVQLGSTTLLVSRGLGAVGAPLRVGAPAEVVVATLARPTL